MKKFLSLVLISIMLLSTVALASCSIVKGLFRTTITASEWEKGLQEMEYYTDVYQETFLKFGVEPPIYAVWQSSLVRSKGDCTYYLIDGVAYKFAEVIDSTSTGHIELIDIEKESPFKTIGEEFGLNSIKFEDLVYEEPYYMCDTTMWGLDVTYKIECRGGKFERIEITTEGLFLAYAYNFGDTARTLGNYVPNYEKDVNNRSLITVDEWNQFRAMDNYTIEGTKTVDGCSFPFVQKVTPEGMEVNGVKYAFGEDGTVYELGENSDGWFGVLSYYTITDNNLSPMPKETVKIPHDDTPMNSHSLIYEYDNKAYMHSSWGGDENNRGYIKFHNGVISEFRSVDRRMGVFATVTIEGKVTNIGTTVVDIPEYTVTDYIRKDYRTTVTEEEWNNNMNLQNCTVEILLDGSYLGCKKVTENAIKSGYDFYTFKDGLTYRLSYNYENERWEARIAEDDFYMKDFLEFYNSCSSTSQLDFSNFEYNDDIQAYVYVWESYSEEFIVRFKDGKLLSVQERALNLIVEQTIVKNIFDIGTTVIEIPEYVIVEE